MRTSFTAALIVLSLASQAFAGIFVTAPVATTTCSGGGRCDISWRDDGAAPDLPSIGDCSIGLYTGNSQQQTLLQEIAPRVNVETTASVQFTPDPLAGPNDSVYFIRFQSLTLRDPAAPTLPYLAFSAIFSLDNMSGSFNQSVQAQIDGITTAPIGGVSTRAHPTSASTTSASTTSRPASTTTSSRASGIVNSATVSPTANAGVKNIAAGAGFGFLAALLGLAF